MLCRKIFLVFVFALGLTGTSVLFGQTFNITSALDNDIPPYTLGELRHAINAINDPSAGSGPFTITFSISSTNSAPVIINLNSTLPAITKTVIINGTTQNGYVQGKPTVIIDGSNFYNPSTAGNTPTPAGLRFNSVTGGKVEGLYIRSFYDAIFFSFCTGCEANYNVINRNKNSNVLLHVSNNCIVKGNYINTDFDRTTFSPQSEEGILFTNNGGNGSVNNTIGGTLCGEGNTIINTKSEGIDNFPNDGSNPTINADNLYSGNIIYNNTFDAIELRNGANTGKSAPVISLTGCTTSGTSQANDVIELFGSTGPLNSKKNANIYMKTVTANSSGVWTADFDFIEFSYITATARDGMNNTSELSPAIAITPSVLNFTYPNSLCVNTSTNFTISTSCTANFTFKWDFGDNTGLVTSSTHTYMAVGTYNVTLHIYLYCKSYSVTKTINVTDCLQPCTNCIGSFAPEAGDYILSAWVKEEDATPTTLTYTDPKIYIDFPSTATNPITPFTSAPVGPFTAQGSIIDGWQRIEEKFTILPSATYINLRLQCSSGNCFFDDIRIFPTNGSMKSYVYDPVTLRLAAELDERNYATFYEYDEEGKLIRVKKETERGVMTIKENRNSTKKK